MKDAVVARGVGLIARLSLLGLLLAGLALLRFAPLVEPDGPKPAPISIIQTKPRPRPQPQPPPPPPPEPVRSQEAPKSRPTPPFAEAPAAPVAIVAPPNAAPMTALTPPSALAATVAATIETARPLGAPLRPIYPKRWLQSAREGVVVIR